MDFRPNFGVGVEGLESDRWWERAKEQGTVMRWCVQDEVNHEESEQNEVDGTKKATSHYDL